MDKKQARKEMITKRLSLDEETLCRYNENILNKIEDNIHFKEAKTVAVYVSARNEVDTKKLMTKYFGKKKIVVPRIEGDMQFYEIRSFDDLKPGYFDIEEPVGNQQVSPDDIDVMIIPMLMFDKNKNRIGYGKGFYDRYMATYKGYKLGIGYSFQQVEDTFPHQYDIRMDEIITNETIL